jgi:hypothetical protein
VSAILTTHYVKLLNSSLITQKSTVILTQEQMQPQPWRTQVRKPVNLQAQSKHGGKRTSTNHTQRHGRNPCRLPMNQVRGISSRRQDVSLRVTISPYSPPIHTDKRTSAWLKLKKDYVEGIGDSLDLVPLGAWHGMGRKAAWWSPILLGVWDAQQGKFVAVCKCMSGVYPPPLRF